MMRRKWKTHIEITDFDQSQIFEIRDVGELSTKPLSFS